MSFSDWTFHQRVTDSVIPSSNILINTTPISPLVGTGSLSIQDSGAPDTATVAFHPDADSFDNLLELGRIRTIFRKRIGSSFEDHGIYFLSQGVNPLHDEVEVYAAYYSSGGTTLRVRKYLSGLHNTASILIGTYTIPFSGSEEPVVLEVEWLAGLLARESGEVIFTVRFGSNTTNFVNLLTVASESVDPLLFTGTCGIFVRSRNASEPLNSRIDMTSIYRKNLA